jgi:hypothetical protein
MIDNNLEFLLYCIDTPDYIPEYNRIFKIIERKKINIIQFYNKENIDLIKNRFELYLIGYILLSPEILNIFNIQIQENKIALDIIQKIQSSFNNTMIIDNIQDITLNIRSAINNTYFIIENHKVINISIKDFETLESYLNFRGLIFTEKYIYYGLQYYLLKKKKMYKVPFKDIEKSFAAEINVLKEHIDQNYNYVVPPIVDRTIETLKNIQKFQDFLI